MRADSGRSPAVPVGEVVLRNELDLVLAAFWLRRVLFFYRSEGCWGLLEPTGNYDSLILGDINDKLTRPNDLVAAQGWATEVLQDEDDQLRRERGLTATGPLEVTRWLRVRYGAHRGYAPLFDFTPPCLVTTTTTVTPPAGHSGEPCATRQQVHD